MNLTESQQVGDNLTRSQDTKSDTASTPLEVKGQTQGDAYLGRVEVSHFGNNVGHVGRVGDVLLVAQDVHCVLPRGSWPVGHVG